MTKTREIDVEQFVFGNAKSIRALTPNGPDEEISPLSYLRFLQLYVHKMGGVVDQVDLEAEIEKHFGAIWGPEDVRPIQVFGEYSRPKWKNSLDWAKVMARKQTPQILSRTQKRKTGKLSVLVLIGSDTDPEWLEFVQKKVKRHFKKKCRSCKRWVGLSAKACPNCQHVFPAASARKHKLPK